MNRQELSSQPDQRTITDSGDLHRMKSDVVYEINKALSYEEDKREDPSPDDEKLDVFNQGWRKAVNGDLDDYGELAHSSLSWHNLGYRLGKIFGETSTGLRRDLYYWCVEQIRE